MDEAGQGSEWHHLEAAPLLHEQEVYKRSWRRTRSCTMIDICSVHGWTRNRVYVSNSPHAGQDSPPPVHKSFNKNRLTCFIITDVMEKDVSGCRDHEAIQKPHWDLCCSSFTLILGSGLICHLLVLNSVRGDSGVLIPKPCEWASPAYLNLNPQLEK